MKDQPAVKLCERCSGDLAPRLPAYVAMGIGRHGQKLDLCDACALEVAAAVAILLEASDAKEALVRWAVLKGQDAPKGGT